MDQCPRRQKENGFCRYVRTTWRGLCSIQMSWHVWSIKPVNWRRHLNRQDGGVELMVVMQLIHSILEEWGEYTVHLLKLIDLLPPCYIRYLQNKMVHNYDVLFQRTLFNLRMSHANKDFHFPFTFEAWTWDPQLVFWQWNWCQGPSRLFLLQSEMWRSLQTKGNKKHVIMPAWANVTNHTNMITLPC